MVFLLVHMMTLCGYANIVAFISHDSPFLGMKVHAMLPRRYGIA